MTHAILYGIISVLPLVLGAYIGAKFAIQAKFIGAVSGFGAGALIAALTFGLMEESFRLGGFDNSVTGFIVGAALFVIGDLIIIQIGGRGHKKYYDADTSTGWGIVLGAVLDGIPESIALGLGLFLNPSVGLLLLVAIFASNMPEAISSGYDLKRIKKPFRDILYSWLAVALIGFVFVILGFTVLSGMSESAIATLQSLAAGAILAMLASTMMPEAYKESGASVSFLTVLGFLVIFILSKLGV